MLFGPHVLGLASDAAAARARGVRHRVPCFHAGSRILARAHGRHAVEVPAWGAQMPLTTAPDRRASWALGQNPALAIVLGGALAMSSTAIVIRQLGDQSELNRTHTASRSASCCSRTWRLCRSLRSRARSAPPTRCRSRQWPPQVAARSWRCYRAVRRPLAAAAALPRDRPRAAPRRSRWLCCSWRSRRMGHASVGLSMALARSWPACCSRKPSTGTRPKWSSGRSATSCSACSSSRSGRCWISGCCSRSCARSAAAGRAAAAKASIVTVLAHAVRAGLAQVGPHRPRDRAGRRVRLRAAHPHDQRHHLASPDRAAAAGRRRQHGAQSLADPPQRPIAEWIMRRRRSRRHGAGSRQQWDVPRRDHVIVCGFGRVGQNVARVLEKQVSSTLRSTWIRAAPRQAREAGDPVVYGDGTHTEILERWALSTATASSLRLQRPGVALGILNPAAASPRRAGAGAHAGRHEAG